MQLQASSVNRQKLAISEWNRLTQPVSGSACLAESMTECRRSIAVLTSVLSLRVNVYLVGGSVIQNERFSYSFRVAFFSRETRQH